MLLLLIKSLDFLQVIALWHLDLGCHHLLIFKDQLGLDLLFHSTVNLTNLKLNKRVNRPVTRYLDVTSCQAQLFNVSVFLEDDPVRPGRHTHLLRIVEIFIEAVLIGGVEVELAFTELRQDRAVLLVVCKLIAGVQCLILLLLYRLPTILVLEQNAEVKVAQQHLYIMQRYLVFLLGSASLLDKSIGPYIMHLLSSDAQLHLTQA